MNSFGEAMIELLRKKNELEKLFKWQSLSLGAQSSVTLRAVTFTDNLTSLLSYWASCESLSFDVTHSHVSQMVISDNADLQLENAEIHLLVREKQELDVEKKMEVLDALRTLRNLGIERGKQCQHIMQTLNVEIQSLKVILSTQNHLKESSHLLTFHQKNVSVKPDVSSQEESEDSRPNSAQILIEQSLIDMGTRLGGGDLGIMQTSSIYLDFKPKSPVEVNVKLPEWEGNLGSFTWDQLREVTKDLFAQEEEEEGKNDLCPFDDAKLETDPSAIDFKSVFDLPEARPRSSEKDNSIPSTSKGDTKGRNLDVSALQIFVLSRAGSEQRGESSVWFPWVCLPPCCKAQEMPILLKDTSQDEPSAFSSLEEVVASLPLQTLEKMDVLAEEVALGNCKRELCQSDVDFVLEDSQPNAGYSLFVLFEGNSRVLLNACNAASRSQVIGLTLSAGSSFQMTSEKYVFLLEKVCLTRNKASRVVLHEGTSVCIRKPEPRSNKLTLEMIVPHLVSHQEESENIAHVFQHILYFKKKIQEVIDVKVQVKTLQIKCESQQNSKFKHTLRSSKVFIHVPDLLGWIDGGTRMIFRAEDVGVDLLDKSQLLLLSSLSLQLMWNRLLVVLVKLGPLLISLHPGEKAETLDALNFFASHLFGLLGITSVAICFQSQIISLDLYDTLLPRVSFRLNVRVRALLPVGPFAGKLLGSIRAADALLRTECKCDCLASPWTPLLEPVTMSVSSEKSAAGSWEWRASTGDLPLMLTLSSAAIGELASVLRLLSNSEKRKRERVEVLNFLGIPVSVYLQKGKPYKVEDQPMTIASLAKKGTGFTANVDVTEALQSPNYSFGCLEEHSHKAETPHESMDILSTEKPKKRGRGSILMLEELENIERVSPHPSRYSFDLTHQHQVMGMGKWGPSGPPIIGRLATVGKQHRTLMLTSTKRVFNYSTVDVLLQIKSTDLLQMDGHQLSSCFRPSILGSDQPLSSKALSLDDTLPFEEMVPSGHSQMVLPANSVRCVQPIYCWNNTGGISFQLKPRAEELQYDWSTEILPHREESGSQSMIRCKCLKGAFELKRDSFLFLCTVTHKQMVCSLTGRPFFVTDIVISPPITITNEVPLPVSINLVQGARCMPKLNEDSLILMPHTSAHIFTLDVLACPIDLLFHLMPSAKDALLSHEEINVPLSEIPDIWGKLASSSKVETLPVGYPQSPPIDLSVTRGSVVVMNPAFALVSNLLFPVQVAIGSKMFPLALDGTILLRGNLKGAELVLFDKESATNEAANCSRSHRRCRLPPQAFLETCFCCIHEDSADACSIPITTHPLTSHIVQERLGLEYPVATNVISLLPGLVVRNLTENPLIESILFRQERDVNSQRTCGKGESMVFRPHGLSKVLEADIQVKPSVVGESYSWSSAITVSRANCGVYPIKFKLSSEGSGGPEKFLSLDVVITSQTDDSLFVSVCNPLSTVFETSSSILSDIAIFVRTGIDDEASMIQAERTPISWRSPFDKAARVHVVEIGLRNSRGHLVEEVNLLELGCRPVKDFLAIGEEIFVEVEEVPCKVARAWKWQKIVRLTRTPTVLCSLSKSVTVSLTCPAVSLSLVNSKKGVEVLFAVVDDILASFRRVGCRANCQVRLGDVRAEVYPYNDDSKELCPVFASVPASEAPAGSNPCLELSAYFPFLDCQSVLFLHSLETNFRQSFEISLGEKSFKPLTDLAFEISAALLSAEAESPRNLLKPSQYYKKLRGSIPGCPKGEPAELLAALNNSVVPASTVVMCRIGQVMFSPLEMRLWLDLDLKQVLLPAQTSLSLRTLGCPTKLSVEGDYIILPRWQSRNCSLPIDRPGFVTFWLAEVLRGTSHFIDWTGDTLSSCGSGKAAYESLSSPWSSSVPKAPSLLQLISLPHVGSGLVSRLSQLSSSHSELSRPHFYLQPRMRPQRFLSGLDAKVVPYSYAASLLVSSHFRQVSDVWPISFRHGSAALLLSPQGFSIAKDKSKGGLYKRLTRRLSNADILVGKGWKGLFGGKMSVSLLPWNRLLGVVRNDDWLHLTVSLPQGYHMGLVDKVPSAPAPTGGETIKFDITVRPDNFFREDFSLPVLRCSQRSVEELYRLLMICQNQGAQMLDARPDYMSRVPTWK